MEGDPGAGELPALFETLGNASRLDLLRQLRRPQRVADLRLTAAGSQPGQAASRPVSRQAVQHHLRRLLEANLVQLHSRGTAFVGNEYLVNQRQLFAVTERLRDLVRLEPAAAELGETEPGIPLRRPSAAPDRSLVLVHGVEEGRSWRFPGSGTLRIGRARACDVRLDYDPYASAHHAQVQAGPDGPWLADLGSRNGTFHNWRQLGKGERRELAAGDAIGIGRSTLVYRG